MRNWLFIFLIALMESLSPVTADSEELQRAIYFFENDNCSSAKASFKNLWKESPQNAEVAYYLGRLYFKAEEVDSSLYFFNCAFELADTVSQYSLWKARALVQKGLQSSPIKKPYYAHQAKKYFQKAVRLNPQNTLARQDLIEFYMRAPGILGGDADKAIKQAQLLQEQNCWEGYKAYGKIYTIEGRFNKAEDTYLAAIEEYPDEMQFYLYLADLYLKHKQFDKAIAICQRVITEMPQKALDMRYKLANIYQQTEHYQEAFAIFEEIIRLKPNQMRAFYQFGCTSILAQQNLERGKESLIQYISHKLKYGCPSLAKAYYKLGQIYELVDNRDEARQQYTLALRINPDYHQASEALAQWQ